jgi:hypothetical protein
MPFVTYCSFLPSPLSSSSFFLLSNLPFFSHNVVHFNKNAYICQLNPHIMKLRHLFTFILLPLFPICSRAQAIYVEVGGASTTTGVHFDSRFSGTTRWGGRLGVAYTYSKDSDFFPSDPDKTTGWSIPAAINYLIGGKRHSVELGIGVSYGQYKCTSTNSGGYTVETDKSGTFGFIDIGYRFQSSTGWILRAGLNPGTGIGTTDGLGRSGHKVDRAAVVYPYFSIGHSL